MTVQCCRCKKIRERREWVVPVDVLPERVSHGFCPACLAETRREFEAEARAYAQARREQRLRASWAANPQAVGANY